MRRVSGASRCIAGLTCFLFRLAASCAFGLAGAARLLARF
jgi:hypothetical protein